MIMENLFVMMYGLPKTHKSNILLRHIVSMVAKPQHELAK